MQKKADIPASFAKDGAMMTLAIFNVALALLAVVSVVLRLRSNAFKVPVQYLVGDGSVLLSSSWYTLYSLALFALVGVGVTIFLAQRLYKGNRLFSGGVLLAQVVVGIVSLLTINALLGLVARV